MSEWTIGAVLDVIAEVIPDRVMTVCGDRRTTFAETADRTRRLANYLAAKGFGAHQERASLQNWECGQDRVALVMHNDLYADMVIGCLKARTVPVNVNYNYTPREVQELLDYVRPRAVIFHKSLVRSSPMCSRRIVPTCCCRSTTAVRLRNCPARCPWTMRCRKGIPTRT